MGSWQAAGTGIEVQLQRSKSPQLQNHIPQVNMSLGLQLRKGLDPQAESKSSRSTRQQTTAEIKRREAQRKMCLRLPHTQPPILQFTSEDPLIFVLSLLKSMVQIMKMTTYQTLWLYQYCHLPCLVETISFYRPRDLGENSGLYKSKKDKIEYHDVFCRRFKKIDMMVSWQIIC